MQFPICKVCLDNDILCNACAEKVGKNEIKADEIKMYRRLNKLLTDQKPLKDVEIKRVLGNEILVIITGKGGVSRLIGKDGRMVKKIAKELNMPIRVIDQPSELKNLINEVLFTVPILGINILYKPEGEVYIIRIPKSDRTKLPVSSEVLAAISRSMFNVDIDVIFE
jgi:transcription antitermination factor NusA-like protein